MMNVNNLQEFLRLGAAGSIPMMPVIKRTISYSYRDPMKAFGEFRRRDFSAFAKILSNATGTKFSVREAKTLVYYVRDIFGDETSPSTYGSRTDERFARELLDLVNITQLVRESTRKLNTYGLYSVRNSFEEKIDALSRNIWGDTVISRLVTAIVSDSGGIIIKYNACRLLELLDTYKDIDAYQVKLVAGVLVSGAYGLSLYELLNLMCFGISELGFTFVETFNGIVYDSNGDTPRLKYGDWIEIIGSNNAKLLSEFPQQVAFPLFLDLEQYDMRQTEVLFSKERTFSKLFA